MMCCARTLNPAENFNWTAPPCSMLDHAFCSLLLWAGANTNVQLELMGPAVQRRVAVKTTANATTPTGCVCVSQDTRGRHVPSDCVLKDTTAFSVKGNVRATRKTRAGTLAPSSLLLLFFPSGRQQDVFMCCCVYLSVSVIVDPGNRWLLKDQYFGMS